MRTMRHPLSGAIYDLTDHGTVSVVLAGSTGEFSREGVWLGGTLRHADPHLCLWISDRPVANRFSDAASALVAGRDGTARS